MANVPFLTHQDCVQFDLALWYCYLSNTLESVTIAQLDHLQSLGRWSVAPLMTL